MQYALTPAVAADVAGAAEVVAALEASLYGPSTFSQGDLEDEWARLDLEKNARVVRDGGRIVAYGALHPIGELVRAEAFVHPDVHGRGIGGLVASGLEQEAAGRGAGRIQNSVFEADTAARELLEELGYRAVRVFREMRIEHDAPPSPPQWPDELQSVPFDPDRDAAEFYAAEQEAFADVWEFTPRDFERWSKAHLRGERFDPSLWCVVRAGDEIVAGTICTGDTFGGGFVQQLFTRRPWRGQGIGAALLAETFGRFWQCGERTVGLAVDAESVTGAFRLYERAGMTPALGWVMYERQLEA